jgi:hypothetical protein
MRPSALFPKRANGDRRSAGDARRRAIGDAVDLLPTGLVEKEAFRALFTVGAASRRWRRTRVWGVSAARQNTASYVADILDLAQRTEPAHVAAIAEAGHWTGAPVAEVGSLSRSPS